MRIAVLDDFQAAARTFDCWNRLPAAAELVVFTDHVADQDRLVARLRDFDVVVRIRERTPLTGEVLRRLPRLKLLVATGHRHAESLDLAAAQACGITVCNTDSILSPTPELTWGLILALFRGLIAENRSVQAGGWQVGLGSAVAGKTLGVVGLGRMGVPVAQIGHAFAMRVVAWSPNLTQERCSKHGVELVTKERLFSTADIVSVHMPAVPATAGIVGRADIGRMKSSAFLVNTSRGSLIDDQALIDALREGRIAGAALDVFEQEPLPLSHPYRHLPNVIATPHIGYVVRETYEIFFSQTVENILAFLAERPIRVLTGLDPRP